MSGGMGYYDGDLFDQDGNPVDPNALSVPQQQNGNPLRDHLKRVEEQLKAVMEQNAELAAERRRTQVADALQAKGYDRGAAGLYGGDPTKLDEWLNSNGQFLAKASTDTSGQGQAQGMGGAPASTVPAEGQAALQQLQGMGGQAAAPAGSDAEQIAQMRNAQTPEALMQYLNSQGNPYHFNG